jgi:hypothetical protein
MYLRGYAYLRLKAAVVYDGYEKVKRPGREADHSLLSSVEVKDGGATPPLSLMTSWRGTKLITHRGQLPDRTKQIVKCLISSLVTVGI